MGRRIGCTCLGLVLLAGNLAAQTRSSLIPRQDWRVAAGLVAANPVAPSAVSVGTARDYRWEGMIGGAVLGGVAGMVLANGLCGNGGSSSCGSQTILAGVLGGAVGGTVGVFVGRLIPKKRPAPAPD